MSMNVQSCDDHDTPKDVVQVKQEQYVVEYEANSCPVEHSVNQDQVEESVSLENLSAPVNDIEINAINDDKGVVLSSRHHELEVCSLYQDKVCAFDRENLNPSRNISEPLTSGIEEGLLQTFVSVASNDPESSKVVRRLSGSNPPVGIHDNGVDIDCSLAPPNHQNSANPLLARSTIPNENQVCEKCEERFRTNQELLRHVIVHTGERPYDTRHQLMHSGEKPYTCDSRHEMIRTKKKLYTCDVCNYNSTDKWHVSAHKLIHTGERPYACDVCDAKFLRHYHLRRHKLTHTLEKPFTCDVCFRSYTTHAYYVQHKRTHADEKPYTCDVCDSKVTTKYRLMVHRRSHTDDAVSSNESQESRNHQMPRNRSKYQPQLPQGYEEPLASTTNTADDNEENDFEAFFSGDVPNDLTDIEDSTETINSRKMKPKSNTYNSITLKKRSLNVLPENINQQPPRKKIIQDKPRDSNGIYIPRKTSASLSYQNQPISQNTPQSTLMNNHSSNVVEVLDSVNDPLNNRKHKLDHLCAYFAGELKEIKDNDILQETLDSIWNLMQNAKYRDNKK